MQTQYDMKTGTFLITNQKAPISVKKALSGELSTLQVVPLYKKKQFSMFS